MKRKIQVQDSADLHEKSNASTRYIREILVKEGFLTPTQLGLISDFFFQKIHVMVRQNPLDGGIIILIGNWSLSVNFSVSMLVIVHIMC